MDSNTQQEAQNTTLMPHVGGKPVCDVFEEMILAGKVRFASLDTAQEEPFVHDLVNLMKGLGLNCQMGDYRVGRSVVLRTDDPYIQYIDVYPETGIYLMSTKRHQESICEGDAMIYLMTEKRGMDKDAAADLYHSVSSGELDGMNIFTGTVNA